MKETCYICGSTNSPTSDHVPPRNLFVPPLPTNLITVTCCEECHKKLTLDDEAFRVFAAALVSRSKQGEWIWKNKVMNSSFKRSSKLKENVRKSLITLKDPKTGLFNSALTFDERRGNRYFVRLTKGLTRHFYPTLDYSCSSFKVMQIWDKNDAMMLLNKCIYDERGGGAFKFWRLLYSDSSPEGIWFYSFYDGAMFMVEVD